MVVIKVLILVTIIISRMQVSNTGDEDKGQG